MLAKTISDLSLSVSSGLTPLRSEDKYWDNGTVPWLKTEQLGEKYIYDTKEKTTDFALENTSLKINPPNTISIAMYGEGKTRGSVSIIKREMATNQACCNIVIDKEKAYFEYVYYFLKTQYKELRNLSSGVRKNLNSNDIKNFSIRLPANVTSQQAIADVLSALDAKIELNNRINAELEAMAKTLYDYWFVQFDFPDENGKPYKSSGGKMVYNETLKREIPAGWEDKYISDIVDNTSQKTVAGESPHLPYVPIDNLPRKKLVSGQRSSNEEAMSSLILFKKYDVLFGAMRPYFHKVCLAIEDGITRTTALILRPKSKKFRFYALMTINTDMSVKFATKNSKGSTIPYTFWDNGYEKLPISLPPEYLMVEYNGIVSKCFEKQITNEKENRELAQLRDWLLPMLMNGQVKVA